MNTGKTEGRWQEWDGMRKQLRRDPVDAASAICSVRCRVFFSPPSSGLCFCCQRGPQAAKEPDQ